MKSTKIKPVDVVRKPPHYTHGKVECIEALESMASGIDSPWETFLACQIVKYVWRHDLKGNPVEDLRKAEFYLEKLIWLAEERVQR